MSGRRREVHLEQDDPPRRAVPHGDSQLPIQVLPAQRTECNQRRPHAHRQLDHLADELPRRREPRVEEAAAVREGEEGPRGLKTVRV